MFFGYGLGTFAYVRGGHPVRYPNFLGCIIFTGFSISWLVNCPPAMQELPTRAPIGRKLKRDAAADATAAFMGS